MIWSNDVFAHVLLLQQLSLPQWTTHECPLLVGLTGTGKTSPHVAVFRHNRTLLAITIFVDVVSNYFYRCLGVFTIGFIQEHLF